MRRQKSGRSRPDRVLPSYSRHGLSSPIGVHAAWRYMMRGFASPRRNSRVLGGMSMKRLTVSSLAAFGLLLVSVAPAFADAGSPGNTFPDQPGTNVATACNSVLTNPAKDLLHDSSTAAAIIGGLIVDACFGG